MSHTLSKFWLPFDAATPAVNFWKDIKRPRNTAGLASNYIKGLISLESIFVAEAAEENSLLCDLAL